MKFKNSNNEWQTLKVTNYGIEQTPIGSMIYYPAQAIPKGYLVCDGREISISEYEELFDIIGYIGGDDVLEGYFRLPDMRGVTAAGYYEGLASTHPLYGAFGDQVGSPTHQLTIDEMPAHTHGFRAVKDYINTDSNNNTGNAKAVNEEGNNTGFTNYATDSIQVTGGSQPHSIVQPTKLYHWLIKAKNVVTLGGYAEDFEINGNLIVNNKNVGTKIAEIDNKQNIGTVLYFSAAGDNSTTITLNDNISNYVSYEIYYTLGANGPETSSRAEVGRACTLFGTRTGHFALSEGSYYGIRLNSTNATISGTTLTKPVGYMFTFKTDNTMKFADNENEIYIRKVVGYKN